MLEWNKSRCKTWRFVRAPCQFQNLSSPSWIHLVSFVPCWCSIHFNIACLHIIVVFAYHMINLSVALASAVSCYGNLVKHTSTVSLSKDKWVLTGGDDHLSLRKLWIPFVWRVALISGSISAAPLVSELADYWGTKESVLNVNVSRGSCQQPVPYGDIMKMDGLHGLVEASLILSVLKS